MNVTETWNIEIRDTNTLFKTYKKDSSKYKEITDVEVSEIINGTEKKFTKINRYMYHVTKDCYYGLDNDYGEFEIAWGASTYRETKTYKITYKVIDAVKNYNDCSELYWQFIGFDFEIPADIVTGKIVLPQGATKENTKIWAHGPLNGDIEIDDEAIVKFELKYFEANTFVEVRIANTENIFINNTNTREKID